jgi:hypothetical protein
MRKNNRYRHWETNCYIGTWAFDAFIRPCRCRNKFTTKWRLRKKWFNRYEKQFYIGKLVMKDSGGDIEYRRVVDVAIRKDGRYCCEFKYIVEPVD